MKKAPFFLLTVIVILLSVTGCAVKDQEISEYAIRKISESGTGAEEYKAIAVDDFEQEFGIIRDAERVVSLAPAITEIIFALESGDKIVGNTTYCDYPEEAKDIEKIGDFQNPNIEKIVALKPDLILATGGVQKNIISRLESQNIPVFIIDPASYDDTVEAIKKTGVLIGKIKESIEIAKGMQETKEKIEKELKGIDRVKVFIELGYEPLFTAGSKTFPDDLVKIAGGKNIAEKEGWLPFSVEQLIESDPDVYISIEGDMFKPGKIEERANYKNLSAVKEGRVYIIMDDLLTLPGPRIEKGLEEVAKALHPEIFEE